MLHDMKANGFGREGDAFGFEGFRHLARAKVFSAGFGKEFFHVDWKGTDVIGASSTTHWNTEVFELPIERCCGNDASSKVPYDCFRRAESFLEVHKGVLDLGETSLEFFVCCVNDKRPKL